MPQASVSLDLLRRNAQPLGDLPKGRSVRLARLAALDAGDRLGGNRAEVALPQALQQSQSTQARPERLIFKFDLVTRTAEPLPPRLLELADNWRPTLSPIPSTRW